MTQSRMSAKNGVLVTHSGWFSLTLPAELEFSRFETTLLRFHYFARAYVMLLQCYCLDVPLRKEIIRISIARLGGLTLYQDKPVGSDLLAVAWRTVVYVTCPHRELGRQDDRRLGNASRRRPKVAKSNEVCAKYSTVSHTGCEGMYW